LEVVRLLVENGADVNARTRGGKTPTAAAKENGHTGIVAFLEGKGAKE
jgi:ankyrin repeat protein